MFCFYVNQLFRLWAKRKAFRLPEEFALAFRYFLLRVTFPRTTEVDVSDLRSTNFS